MKTTLFASFSALLVLLCQIVLVGASQDASTVIRKIDFKDEPVEIGNIRSEGRNILFNRNFTSGPDWLRGLSFDVRNASDKAIVFVRVGLQFSPASPTSDPGLYFLQKGTDRHDKPDAKVFIAPGGVITFEITQANYASIRKLRRDIGWKDSDDKINEVSFRVEKVIFDDDSAWATGLKQRRNAQNPAKWDVIEEERIGRKKPTGNQDVNFATPHRFPAIAQAFVSPSARTPAMAVQAETKCVKYIGDDQPSCKYPYMHCTVPRVIFTELQTPRNTKVQKYTLICQDSMGTDCACSYTLWQIIANTCP